MCYFKGVRQFTMGDQRYHEFMELYRPLHGAFVRFCSSHGYGIIDTDDLVQETILHVLQRFGSVREKEKLLGYMIATASNLVKNQLRRRKFQGQFNENAFRKLESRTGNAELSMEIHLLYEAMNKLPHRDKEALILFEINGFSMQEIAVIQQSQLSATKTRISRARQKLRELLDDEPKTRRLVSKTPQLFMFL